MNVLFHISLNRIHLNRTDENNKLIHSSCASDLILIEKNINI